MAVVIIIFLTAYLLLEVWQLRWLISPRTKPNYPDTWPTASVLLAARNEEPNILRCLDALSQVDYPHLEVIVGNDRSEDGTAHVVQSFQRTNPEFNLKLIEIEGLYPQTMAKAAVLAELAHHTEAAIFLITDADIAVPKTWAKELIAHYQNEKVGIVSGTTYIKGKGVWGNLQSIDWIYFMCLVESFHLAGVNTTAIGNNMSIRAKTYWETGGYENIPFSITEDYKIYQKATALGWKAVNVCNAEVLAIGNPIEGMSNLLHQRKRWLLGAKELPSNWWILFIIFAFYYPLSLVLFVMNPVIASIILLLKFSLQLSYILISSRRLGIHMQKKVPYLFLYEIYLYTVTITTLVFFILPLKTEWKGRKY